MPDKWAQYAVPNDKWAQYAQPVSPAAPTPPPPAAPPQQGFFGSALDSSGLTGLGHAIMHPVDTVAGIPAAVKGAVQDTKSQLKQGLADYNTSGLSQTTRRDFGRAIPIIGPALATAQAQHDSGNNAGMAGTLAGTVAGLAAPAVLKGGLEAAAPVLQDAGVARINGVVGALKGDFARGANPGKGYFQARLGPSSSMGSIAEKANAANEAFGEKIGNAIDNSPLSRIGVKIPVNDAAKAIAEPLNRAHAVLSGPGSLASSAAPIEELSASFRPAIQQAVKNGGFSPRELFDLKKNVAANTAWSDPLQIGLKQARQQIVGGLGETLSDNLPELGDLNSGYRNTLKLAARAEDRAVTNRPSLSGVGNKLIKAGAIAGGAASGGVPGAIAGAIPALMDSVPVQTSLASGLYYGGGAARRLAPLARLLPPPAVLAIPDKKVPKR